MKRRDIFLVVLGIIIILGLVMKDRKTNNPKEHIGYALDTQIRIVVYDKNAPLDISKKAYDVVTEKEKILSNFIDSSETSLLNEKKSIKAGEDLYKVLKVAYDVSHKTGGAYDVTIRPLTKLWHYKNSYVPDDSEIKEAKSKVSYTNLMIDGRDITLKNDASVDVSSVAKGYIADKVIDYLKEQGIKNALVDAGGNIKVMGSPGRKKDKGFKIGIQDPMSDIGIPFAEIEVKDESIVTSGIYERKFIKDGKTYHHIIDPFIGKPVSNDLLAVSVVCKDSVKADAYATAIMVLGEEKGLSFIKSENDAKCIIIKKDLSVVTSCDIESLRITNNKYKLRKVN